MSLEELKAIRSEITARGYAWSARRTALSDLSDDERAMMCGLVMESAQKEALTLEIADADARDANEGIAFAYATSWDWRDVNGRNWTTEVKDQGGCGSCVAFATVAVMESNFEIFKKRPTLEPNLSEADLFFCGGSYGCKGGWLFEPALEYSKQKGVPDEACYKYRPEDQACGTCSDRDKRALKIKNWTRVLNESQAKEWICKHGPVLSGMDVYDDFFHYTAGIYRRTSNKLMGGHAIALVGYDDVGRYWICKNSWGTQWGDKGWFRMAYGECGTGNPYPFYTVEF